MPQKVNSSCSFANADTYTASVLGGTYLEPNFGIVISNSRIITTQPPLNHHHQPHNNHKRLIIAK